MCIHLSDIAVGAKPIAGCGARPLGNQGGAPAQPAGRKDHDYCGTSAVGTDASPSTTVLAGNKVTSYSKPKSDVSLYFKAFTSFCANSAGNDIGGTYQSSWTTYARCRDGCAADSSCTGFEFFRTGNGYQGTSGAPKRCWTFPGTSGGVANGVPAQGISGCGTGTAELPYPTPPLSSQGSSYEDVHSSSHSGRFDWSE